MMGRCPPFGFSFPAKDHPELRAHRRADGLRQPTPNVYRKQGRTGGPRQLAPLQAITTKGRIMSLSSCSTMWQWWAYVCGAVTPSGSSNFARIRVK